MSDEDVRELVRIRFELRQLAVGGACREEAASWVDRLSALAGRALEPPLKPEVQRWRAFFRLDA